MPPDLLDKPLFLSPKLASGIGFGPRVIVSEAALRATADRVGAKAGDLFSLVRLAVTGKNVTPPLFESMTIVGADPCVARVRAAEAAIRASA